MENKKSVDFLILTFIEKIMPAMGRYYFGNQLNSRKII